MKTPEKRINSDNKKTYALITDALIWGGLVFILSMIICVIMYVIAVHKDESGGSFLILVAALEGVVGALTCGFIIPQLKNAMQIEMQENQIHVLEFYHSFITYWLETDKLFIEHPECRKYFYCNASLDGLDPMSDEYQLVMSFAEYFDDLFRYSPAELIKQMNSFSVIPLDQIESYIHYMKGILHCPAILQYRADNALAVNFNSDPESKELKDLENQLALLSGKKCDGNSNET